MILTMRSIFSLLTLCSLGCYAEREHKVHNIVLYPEKHSWCQTTPIQQVVSSPGYISVTIQNNVCVGACFSYSIPKSEPAEPGEVIGPYCDSCQPSELKYYNVNLKTDDGGNAEAPKIFQKHVQVIFNCSCQTCDKIRTDDFTINGTNTQEELPLSFYVQESSNKGNEDYIHPDLFEAQNFQNHHFENNVKLKNKLKKWFETWNSEETKNPDLDLDIEKKNEKIMKDLEGLPKTIGIEGAPSHQKGSHIGMGIVHHPNDIVDPDAKKLSDQSKPNHHHHHHHHHHLGEEQRIGSDLTHLVRGPHGSMVAAPTEVKLHIDSDSLKPNDEGLVVEYENHHHRDGTSVKIADLVGSD